MNHKTRLPSSGSSGTVPPANDSPVPKIRAGRLTIPTDTGMVKETLDLMQRWGADALRDCDGTEFPEELRDTGALVYATYYTTRRDNRWARENPDEIQQCYIMTAFHTAGEEALRIPLMNGYSRELLLPNTGTDIRRWWEVIDRTSGEPLPPEGWHYVPREGAVIIPEPRPWHEYTVSFLAFLIWDPVHMYNTTVNKWDEEPQLTFDVRQPKTREWTRTRLRRFLETRPWVDVVRFTTFFHQFTLIFDELRREKYVDWFGYSASVSPHILEQFEKECGYPFRPEYIIDQGYYNNQYRIPSRHYLDFLAFQRREVAALVAELTAIVHEYGRQAMMFLGDHWIGTEPFMPEFASSGLDAVVGSVGNGSTLRLISDIPGIGYTEGRLLPYFFPDTFRPGGNPVKEGKENWISARRALLRNPLDRIGYGGYLSLTLEFPDFLNLVESVTREFRDLHEKTTGARPFCFCRVGILNCWGKMRSWGAHMVHHALYQQENLAYAGIPEILSGAPHEVRFISFDDLRNNPALLDELDVLINVGGMGTAHSGGSSWIDEAVIAPVRSFIARGGGFIGVGEPAAHPHQGRIFQLASALGVELENGYTLGYDKYNWTVVKDHFITSEATEEPDFGPQRHPVYALEGTVVLRARNREVQLAANEYGRGRCVYFSGLPYSLENARLLHRALLWCSRKEKNLHTWFSSNCRVDVHAYVDRGYFCAVNNTDDLQESRIFKDDGSFLDLRLEPGRIVWLGC